MDECIAILDTGKYRPNDEILAQQVLLQPIVEKLALTKWFNGAVGGTGPLVSPNLEPLLIIARLDDCFLNENPRDCGDACIN